MTHTLEFSLAAYGQNYRQLATQFANDCKANGCDAKLIIDTAASRVLVEFWDRQGA